MPIAYNQRLVVGKADASFAHVHWQYLQGSAFRGFPRPNSPETPLRGNSVTPALSRNPSTSTQNDKSQRPKEQPLPDPDDCLGTHWGFPSCRGLFGNMGAACCCLQRSLLAAALVGWWFGKPMCCEARLRLAAQEGSVGPHVYGSPLVKCRRRGSPGQGVCELRGLTLYRYYQRL